MKMKNMGTALLSLTSIFYASGSYLEVPRISFNGHVRIDVNTRNNVNCNFDTQIPLDPDPNDDWNSNGTSEFSFLDCNVTSALNTAGSYVGSSDPVLGAKVLTNIDQSFPKLVDLDVDYQLIKSSVYGLNLLLEVNNKVALQATLESNVLAQDVWTRSLCTDYMSTYLSSKTVSILSNVQWGNGSKESATLSELKEVSNGGNLSISMVIYFYTRNMPSFLYTNFTLGYVMGTIGVARPTEPLNFAASRLLSYKDAYPVNIPIADKSDSCYESLRNETPVWMYKAPFTTYQTSTHITTLAVDFSNALAFDTNGNTRDLGELQLAVHNVEPNCTLLIGKPLTYLEQEWNKKGAIVDYTLDSNTARLVESSNLMVVRIVRDTFEFEQQLKVAAAAAGINYLPPPCNGMGGVHLQLMLNETQYYVRTMDYYVGRLEYKQTMDVRILVTQYGQPQPNITVTVMQSNNVLPPQGVYVLQSACKTDPDGIATFTFQANNTIPFPRQYSNDSSQTTKLPNCSGELVTTLPIDGQVYLFSYSVPNTAADKFTYPYDVFTDVNEIAILGYSYYVPTERPYTWKKDIEPIFSQYDHLYGKVMRPIVQLSNFRSVTIQQNLNLIQLAMSLDVNHPSYMPVTRDLSPTKRNIILEWLTKPIFDEPSPTEKTPFEVPICSPPKSFAATSLAESYFCPPRCGFSTRGTKYNLDFFNPIKSDTYFEDIFQPSTSPSDIETSDTKCTLPLLKHKLQLAMQLEFSTIPPYLTALYSIIEGCNLQIQQLIRSIVMQEMMHLLQVTNILIAIGGEPKIDNSSVVPHYPTTGLPGGVLPRLRISLKKLTLIHVYDVFMGIEVPHDTHINDPDGVITNHTIGQFYKHINDCIHELGDGIFLESRVERQVMWPWPTNLGTVHYITDVSSASNAIKEIVEQGEGVSPFDPKDGDLNRLAHFYKFEEIVCQKRLIKTQDGHYAYEGHPIPFNPQGVWPMKANPSSADIPPNNNCYTEAKAFHGAYRSLLRNLQDIFSGKVDGTTGMKNAVTIMESMAVHARKLMWTKIRPEDDQTCGPVWDFDWVESKCT